MSGTNPFSAQPYDNLVNKGATATHIATAAESKGWEKLFSNTNLTSLSVSYLAQDQATNLDALKNLETLELFNGMVSDLTSLTRLKRLQNLSLEVTGHIKDFAFLGGLKQLRTLKLIDVTKFKDVSVLERLPLLHTLWISKRTSSVSLPTLAPFAKLKQLRALHLGYDSTDGNLSPLAKLTNLKALTLPLSYALEEYARLAAALPQVVCSCFNKPYRVGVSIPNCKRCGGGEKVYLAKGIRSLCPKCDDDKFQAYLKRFEEMKSEFRRGASA
jgi:hypothetical protein